MRNTLMNQITGGATVRRLPVTTRTNAAAADALAVLAGDTVDARQAIAQLEVKATAFAAAHARVTALLDGRARETAQADLRRGMDLRSPEERRRAQRALRRGGVTTSKGAGR